MCFLTTSIIHNIAIEQKNINLTNSLKFKKLHVFAYTKVKQKINIFNEKKS